MAINSYYAIIDSSRPYEVDRRSTVKTSGKGLGTSLTVGYQQPDAPHSGVQHISPDIYFGNVSGV